MTEEIRLDRIDPIAAILAVNATLRRIDTRLVDHGDRVAYIACALNRRGAFGLSEKELLLLCVFHDIGAYKTEEIDRMLEFETTDALSHSVYGYLFLKYLTPLSGCAEAILYHHDDWAVIERAQSAYGSYAAMIHLADRIDVLLQGGSSPAEVCAMLLRGAVHFCPAYLNTAVAVLEEGAVTAALADGSFHTANIALCGSLKPSTEEALEYLKMVVYSIDFRSEHTVTHTVNTVAIALHLAAHFALPMRDREAIYLGALLHDIGKIAIPFAILESPGRLTEAKMAIMRTHVEETGHLISGIVPEEICQLALRHHEKLDGSGYPARLTAAQLTFPQRIIAVADIVSALSTRRSYKDPFPKEKTLAILTEMSARRLDPRICAYINGNYETVMTETEDSRREIIGRYQSIREEYARMTQRRRAPDPAGTRESL